MNIKRYLYGKLSVVFCHWHSWRDFGMSHYWSGRLIYFDISKLTIVLDCRENWVDDMINGVAK